MEAARIAADPTIVFDAESPSIGGATTSVSSPPELPSSEVSSPEFCSSSSSSSSSC